MGKSKLEEGEVALRREVSIVASAFNDSRTNLFFNSPSFLSTISSFLSRSVVSSFSHRQLIMHYDTKFRLFNGLLSIRFTIKHL